MEEPATEVDEVYTADSEAPVDNAADNENVENGTSQQDENSVDQDPQHDQVEDQQLDDQQQTEDYGQNQFDHDDINNDESMFGILTCESVMDEEGRVGV